MKTTLQAAKLLLIVLSAGVIAALPQTPTVVTPPALVVSRPHAQQAQFHTRALQPTATVGQAFTYTPALPAGSKCTEAPFQLGSARAPNQREAAGQAAAAAVPASSATAKKRPQRKPVTQLSQQSAFSYSSTTGAITGTPTKMGMAGFVFTCTATSGQTRKIPVIIRVR